MPDNVINDENLFERSCPPKVLLADKNDQNWLKNAFNPQPQ